MCLINPCVLTQLTFRFITVIHNLNISFPNYKVMMGTGKVSISIICCDIKKFVVLKSSISIENYSLFVS